MKKYFLFDDENINGTTFLQRHFFIFLLPIFIYSTSMLLAYFVPSLISSKPFSVFTILRMIILVYLLPMFYMLSVLSFKRSKTLGHNIILRLFISLLYPFFFFGALSPDKPEESFIIIISIPIVIFIFLWLGIYSKNKNFGFSNEYPSIINKVNCKNLRFLNVFTKKVNYKNSKFLDWILKRKKNILMPLFWILKRKKYISILPLDTSTGLVTFDEVINCKGVDTDELYSALREWLAISFNNSESVLQMDDRESGKLIAKGRTEIKVGGITYPSNFILKIYIREGRFKYMITNIVYDNGVISGIEYKNPIEDWYTGYTTKGRLVKWQVKYHKELVKFAYNIENDIKNHIRSLSNKDDIDDW